MNRKLSIPIAVIVSAIALGLPVLASANWSVTPGNATFTGSASAGSLSAAGEPTITCEGPNTASGAYDGSGTTGSAIGHLTNCRIVVLGVILPCSTTGKPSDATVTATGTFHNVTITGGKRGTLMTLTNTILQCQNIKKLTIQGSMIGEVTSPTGPCPLKTTKATGTAVVIGGQQAHTKIDGSSTEYVTTVTTEGGTTVRGAESASGSVNFNSEVTIDC
ncbi:MAG TPA: hypothetical protein VNM38_08390 [Solirubrobacterales bacterium]|nr:hypothetical protein [Solirubrobacterales bacterium]